MATWHLLALQRLPVVGFSGTADHQTAPVLEPHPHIIMTSGYHDRLPLLSRQDGLVVLHQQVLGVETYQIRATPTPQCAAVGQPTANSLLPGIRVGEDLQQYGGYISGWGISQGGGGPAAIRWLYISQGGGYLRVGDISGWGVGEGGRTCSNKVAISQGGGYLRVGGGGGGDLQQ